MQEGAIEVMNEEKNSRFSCNNDDMEIGDSVCDFCIYRIAEDPSCCGKYPNGKPDELLDPNYYCPLCTMTDFDNW